MVQVQHRLGVSERRACRVLSQARSTHRHRPVVPDDEPRLVARLIELATLYGRYGSRRITGLLRGEGWTVNHKRIERLWRREGLKVPQKQPKRGRLWFADGSCIRRRPEYRHHVWAYDFVADRTQDGRPLKILTIVEEYSRECLAIVVARWLRSIDVLETLAELFVTHGVPAHIRSACYEQVVKALKAQGSRRRWVVQSRDRYGLRLGGAGPSCVIRTHTRGAEGARRKYVELSSTRRAQDNGGHGLLSGWSRSLRFLRGDRLVPPHVVSIERRAVLDDGERVVQQFGHAGPGSPASEARDA